MRFSRFIYDLFIRGLAVATWLSAPLSSKITDWVKGRKQWRKTWKTNLSMINSDRFDHLVWMHAASLGEFEQGLPLLKAIKTKWPKTATIVTFFSPSGYNHVVNEAAVDVKGYLPLDTKKNAADFVSLINPDLVLWVKYEYWFHFINQVHQQNIPLYLISGIIRQDQPFFKWYGVLHRYMLTCFDKVFLQNENSADHIKNLLPAKTFVVAGDTRFDQVVANRNTAINYVNIETWCKKFHDVIVAGSTWEEDEKLLSQAAAQFPEVGFLIVPHNVGEDEVSKSLRRFINIERYTAYQPGDNYQALLIDTTGMLKFLYRYGTIAYIGGGFTSDGIHNVPEAAAYGLPVIHGPNYKKYAEATDLVEIEASTAIKDSAALNDAIQTLLDDAVAKKKGKAAQDYIAAGSGATEIIMNYIQAKRLLTSE